MLSFTVTPSVCMSSLAVLHDSLCGHRPADLGSTEAKKGSRAKPGTPCRWGYEGGVARVCACHVWRREATRLVVCAVEVVRVAVLVLECNPVRVGVGSSLSRQAIRRLGSPLPPQGVLRVDPLDQVPLFTRVRTEGVHGRASVYPTAVRQKGAIGAVAGPLVVGYLSRRGKATAVHRHRQRQRQRGRACA